MLGISRADIRIKVWELRTIIKLSIIFLLILQRVIRKQYIVAVLFISKLTSIIGRKMSSLNKRL